MADTDQTTATTETVAQPTRFAFIKNKKSKLALTLIAVLAIVLGASAAAYYGAIVPNKPENVLKTAIEKQLQKQQVASRGSLNLDMKKDDAQLKNIVVGFDAMTDSGNQTLGINLEAKASGATLPIELRVVENSLYFKVGDLGSIKGLAALAGGTETKQIVDVISDKVSNQWVEVDQSLLKQANAGCTTELVKSFSQKDLDELMKVYGENTFLSINNTSTDTINGRDTTKFELDLDNQKATAFSEKLGNVEALKKINDCVTGATNSSGDTNVKDEVKDTVQDANVSLYVWVDSDKNLRQIEVKIDDEEASGTFTITFTDDAVDVQKPSDSKPLLEVFGDFNSILGTSGAGFGQNLGDSDDVLDSLSDECKAAFQTYITSNGESALPQECL